MDQNAIIVASLNATPSHDGSELRTLGREADWLDVRAGQCGDLDPDWLRNHFGGSLMYSLTRRPAAGEASYNEDARRDRLRWAGRCFDLVELEAPHDLTPEILDHVPPASRLVAWRGAAEDESMLAKQFRQMTNVKARVYKLVCTAQSAVDGLVPLAFLKSLGRGDTVAYAEGASGFWSRMLAPYLGCPMVFARLDDETASADEPSVAQLVLDYGLPLLCRPTELFGIVGNPVLKSLSPRLHNAGYRALGRRALYLPFQAESFSAFWDGVANDRLFERLGMAFKGFTVTSPHKEAATDIAAYCTETVRRCASSNLISKTNGAWTSGTTDSDGVLDCLRAAGLTVHGKRAAVVGCGGAGRAIAAALAAAGAQVTLVNRGLRRGRWAARILDLPLVPLDEVSVSAMNIVVHATPLGRVESDPLPFDLDELSPGAVLVDLVYGVEPTPLASKARALGCYVIDGYDVLAAQVDRQFELMTRSSLPAALGRGILNAKLAN